MSFFAESLKALRQELNMTMQVLAEKACVSKSMICKIEHDEVQPTLDVATRLARALNKSLSEMLHAPETTSVVFIPYDQQAVWEDSQHIKRRNISPVFEGLKLEWLEVELPPNTSIPARCPIGNTRVEKYFLVINGVLEVRVNQEVYTLHKGDSLFLDASAAHEYLNSSNTPTVFHILVKY